MSTISTFSGFTMARLGIMASSKALEVTGNNISNINTQGYTRQVLDQRALYIGGADRYASQFDVRVGAGALTTGVSQLRDPYLDIRYRNENANVGFYNTKYNILDGLSLIMDEVGKGDDDGGFIEAELNRLLEELQVMNTEHAGDQSYDANVRQAAQALTGYFNTYATQLETQYDNTFKEYNARIGEVNSLLTAIRDLNEQIKKAEIGNGALSEAERKAGMIGERGQQALELRDERNLKIDELSQYMPIDVTYSDESIGAGMTVEKLTITLKGYSSVPLIDGTYCGQLSIQQVQKDPDTGEATIDPLTGGPNYVDTKGNVTRDDPYLRLQLSVLTDKNGRAIGGANKPGGKVVRFDDVNNGDVQIESGSLKAYREMLTATGEYSTAYEIQQDEQVVSKRGIRFYQNTLDALANKIAKVFNEANMNYVDSATNQVKSLFDEDGNLLTDADGNPLINYAGALFSNSGDGNDPSNITAKNIAVSLDWQHGDVRVVQTRYPENNNLTTANDNIAHLIAEMQKDQVFKPDDINFGYFENNPMPHVGVFNPEPFFTGSFQGMLTYVNEVLGGDIKSTSDICVNHLTTAQELDMSRESVAGVDLNDETISMMQYQKAYSASCRLLTTLDEILDKLINGTGIAGR